MQFAGQPKQLITAQVRQGELQRSRDHTIHGESGTDSQVCTLQIWQSLPVFKRCIYILMSLISQVPQGQMPGAQGCLCQLSQNHTPNYRMAEVGQDLWSSLVLQSLFRDCMPSTAPLIHVTPEACRWLSLCWGKGWRQSQQASIEFKSFWWAQVFSLPHSSRHTSPEDFRRGEKGNIYYQCILCWEGQGCASMHTQKRVLNFALRSQGLHLFQMKYLTV